MTEAAIVWFRQDLRLADNPALRTALENHQQVIPVYIYADDGASEWLAGAASRWWLHHSLQALDQSLKKLGSRLIIRCGQSSQSILEELLQQTGAQSVYWNRQYEPHPIERDSLIKQALRDRNIAVHSFNSTLLHEPWEITKTDGGPYRVFTPYWKACIKAGMAGSFSASPEHMPAVSKKIKSAKIESLELLPKIGWAASFADYWQPGEAGAHQSLDRFLENTVNNYGDDRDRPDLDGTSRLSPHLHFGEISPQQIIEKTTMAVSLDSQPGMVTGTDAFVRELGWREFAYYLLYHFPHSIDRPLYDRFDDFPWEKDYAQPLHAWQQGQTGIPIVDAGMRELWHTGWMHNRVRMIVASLLTKNMLIPWQEGARWFRDTLVDADLASNTLGWQWSAGCGADAAPWFRIFNPVTQAEKFDPAGRYIRQWVPEIAALPNKYLSRPWEASTRVLNEHGIRLGSDYPQPVLDLKATRERALDRYQSFRKSAAG
ncbi:MAG: deoxyribodipyrimidine photo-lyase [Thiotrichales bacterium]|nr:MAG: deoxyribodipyrimidine photo-lyase [Thiotrichales bacterium]